MSNREAFVKGEKGKKWGTDELACDLIRDKDENCKHLKTLYRSIPRVLL